MLASLILCIIFEKKALQGDTMNFSNIMVKVRNSKLLTFISLGFFGIGIGLLSLYFAAAYYKLPMLFSYIKNFPIFVLNVLPVIFLIITLYVLVNKVWLSFLLASVLTLSLTLVNYFKIVIRNDPLIMKDLTLISESLNMIGEFTIKFNWQMNVTILLIILITLFSKYFFKAQLEIKSRLIIFSSLLIIGVFTFNSIYANADLYEATENYDLINRWSQTQTFVSKGFVYPFLYSYTNLRDTPPEGYEEDLVIEILSQYEDSKIPEDKKVDIIGIMLEGFNDFSKFEEIEFLENIYDKWHELEDNSYSGELVNNIFAGETVDTEWGFLTGFTNYHEFRSLTSSYVHYFKSQGYIVEGSHPCYQWFYNRENVNEYLGFDNYYFFENHYAKLANNTIARDRILLPEIINLHQKAKESPSPYFSFNVTYQNHGPYPATHTGDVAIISRDNVSEASYNIMNNYLLGIKDTINETVKFVEYYKDKNPVIIVLFGDHNPWLGDNNSVYHDFGINIDLDTEEGFFNYYNTPYLIWANNSAKEVLGNEFVGSGKKIGPSFLMNKVFHLAKYEGNAFMKLSNSLMKETTLVHRDGYYLVNERLVRNLSEKAEETLKDFLIGQYYYRTNFVK